jgi:hypothetical protein
MIKLVDLLKEFEFGKKLFADPDDPQFPVEIVPNGLRLCVKCIATIMSQTLTMKPIY